MVHAESLLAVLGEAGLRIGEEETNGRAAQPARSPGLLPKHYAPRAKMLVLSWQDEAELEAQVARFRVPFRQCHIIAHTRLPARSAFGRVSVIPHDAEAFGRAIYAELHRCDEEGAGLIVVEAVPDTAEWQAIRDRLERASVVE
jgi:L-threonylcarbamoyladenylate synthase